MSKIHIFIDGTWLFKVCGAGAALSYTTDSPTYPFLIDWNKFDSSLRQHTEQQSNTQIELGERFFSLQFSIFLMILMIGQIDLLT
jgi:hypothetical protein